MNPVLKTVLTHASVGVLGAGVGGGTAIVMGSTNGAHETFTLAIGDSVVPRFSVKTDSVLRVVGSNIIAQRCGISNIFLRTWTGTVQRSADTVVVTVPCAPPVDTPVASVGVCFANPDSAAKYGIRGDVSPTPEQLSHIRCDSTADLTLDPTQAQPAINRRSTMFPQKPPVQSNGDVFADVHSFHR